MGGLLGMGMMHEGLRSKQPYDTEIGLWCEFVAATTKSFMVHVEVLLGIDVLTRIIKFYSPKVLPILCIMCNLMSYLLTTYKLCGSSQISSK